MRNVLKYCCFGNTHHEIPPWVNYRIPVFPRLLSCGAQLMARNIASIGNVIRRKSPIFAFVLVLQASRGVNGSPSS